MSGNFRSRNPRRNPNEDSRRMNVFLTGFRGSGKSAVGRELAELAGLEFVDTDEEVELLSGKTVKEIFDCGGEKAFREIEKRVVLDTCSRENLVVALGGGALADAGTARAVKNAGIVVFLNAPAEVLHRRIESDGATAGRRPPLTRKGGFEETRELLERRLPLYREVADAEVDAAAGPPRVIAERIESLLEGHCRKFSGKST